MNDFLTIKHEELQWAKANNRFTLAKVLTERSNQFSGKQLTIF